MGYKQTTSSEGAREHYNAYLDDLKTEDESLPLNFEGWVEEILNRCRCEYEKKECPRSVEISDDGRHLVVRTHPNRTYLYSINKDGENKETLVSLEKIFQITGEQIMCAKLSPSLPADPDKKFIALGTTAYTTQPNIFSGKLQNDTSGSELISFGLHKKSVNGISFSPNGKYMATASSDKTAKIVDLNGFNNESQVLSVEEIKLDGHGRIVKFSPDGKIIAISDDNDIVLYNDKGERLTDFKYNNPDNPNSESALKLSSLNYSKDGKYLAVARQGRNVQLFNLENNYKENVFEDTERQRQLGQSDVAISNDSNLIAVSTGDNSVRIYRLDNQKSSDESANESSLNIVSGKTSSNPFSVNNAIQTIRFKRGPKDHWWNIHHLPEGFDWDNDPLPQQLQSQMYKQIKQLKFSPDDKFLATGDDNSEVKIFQKGLGNNCDYSLVYSTRVAELDHEASYDGVNDLAFSPDNSILAIASEKKLRLVHLESEKPNSYDMSSQ
jgi:WD40 repeat protein